MEIEEVKKISDVAKIRLTDEELKSLANELDNLLSYFSKVEEINTEGIKEGSYMHDISNTLREDSIKEQDEDTKERIRSEFTKREGNLLIAPKSLK